MVEDEWFDSSNGQKYFSKPSDRSRGPTSHLLNTHRGEVAPEVKQPEGEAQQPHPQSARVKNEWVYTSTPAHICMVCTVTILNFPPLILQRRHRTLRSWFMLGTSSKAESYSGNTLDQCFSNFSVCGTPFQTEIPHGTPALFLSRQPQVK